MEMSESDHVVVEIPSDQPASNYNNLRVVEEWERCLKGNEISASYTRQRHIEKVPPLLFECGSNRKFYEPAVVSLGPYHYKLQTRLAQAEEYKLITLEEYGLSTGLPVDALYDKVFEVVHDARKCYIDGSTDAYNDEEFNRMMLHDACFILFFIECLARADNKLLLNNEYIGAIGFANVMRDIFLLENQIPFVVIEVLLKLRFPDDEGEDILNRFFNYLNYGEAIISDEKVLGDKQPLHLLELYRSYFIAIPTNPIMRSKMNFSDEYIYNYVKQNRWFGSAMELKSRWIFLRATDHASDITFHSYFCYGVFELPTRAISPNTKVIYLNMMAHELCAHNPNDYRVSTYIRIMKSLINRRDDVKELKKKGILIHSLVNDEQVVKMYDEIDVPGVNLRSLNQVWLVINRHLDSCYKTWAGELITEYLSSPWKTAGLFAGTVVLVTSCLQTYFAAKQCPDR
ncbi:hypothetical protein Hdeb2414_s0001g00041401 [Helianthus debilis subsp. tardiflorus]